MPNHNYQSRTFYIGFSLVLILITNGCVKNKFDNTRISFGSNLISNTTFAKIDSPQPVLTQPITIEKSWYADFDALTAIASVGALVLSVVALLQSYQNVSEQKKREKREELRNSLEKLVNFREDFDERINKIRDGNERVALSRYLNTKRGIHIHVVESIAAEIPSQISSSEYFVLAAENYFDSDFLQARSFYEKAVRAAQKRGTSKFTKCTALRGLGWSFYWQEPYRDVLKGRKYYQDAVDIMIKENDSYSVFTVVFSYREWAASEISAGLKDKDYAIEKLSNAREYLEKLPDWYSLKHDELREVAKTMMQLGVNYFQDHSLDEALRREKARETFSLSLDIIAPYNDDTNKDVRGQIYQEWARNEFLWGDKAKGEEMLEQATHCYTNLSEDYPPRVLRLNGIQDILHYVNSKLSEKHSSARSEQQMASETSTESIGMPQSQEDQ